MDGMRRISIVIFLNCIQVVSRIIYKAYSRHDGTWSWSIYGMIANKVVARGAKNPLINALRLSEVGDVQRLHHECH